MLGLLAAILFGADWLKKRRRALMAREQTEQLLAAQDEEAVRAYAPHLDI